jgi:hypothetical protein
VEVFGIIAFDRIFRPPPEIGLAAKKGGLTAKKVDLQRKWWTYSQTTLLTELKNGLTDLKSGLAALFCFIMKKKV